MPPHSSISGSALQSGFNIAKLHNCNQVNILVIHQIYVSQVYFWDEQSELKLMHSENMYPPRFTLQVHGENATHDTVALVEFGGACVDLSTEIYLSLPTRGTQDAH